MPRWRAAAADVLGRHEEKARFLVVGSWNVAFSLAVLWLLERAPSLTIRGSALQKEAIFFLDRLIAVTHNFFTLEGVDPAGVFETGGAERPE